MSHVEAMEVATVLLSTFKFCSNDVQIRSIREAKYIVTFKMNGRTIVIREAN